VADAVNPPPLTISTERSPVARNMLFLGIFGNSMIEVQVSSQSRSQLSHSWIAAGERTEWRCANR